MHIVAKTKQLNDQHLSLLQEELRLVSDVQECLQKHYLEALRNPSEDISLIRQQQCFWEDEMKNIQRRIELLQTIIMKVEKHICDSADILDEALRKIKMLDEDAL